MRHRLGLTAAGWAGALIALCLALPSVRALAQQTLCAQVTLEILQKATLEREAFDAHLIVNNNLPDQPLSSFKVQIFVKDSNGSPVDSLFFVKVTTLTGINAIDGTGVIQSSSTADIHWLIIPSSGTGGINPAGSQYRVSALINGISNGVPQNITTFDAFITVHPQPVIKLEYALPFEVFGQEPLLSPLVTPIEPFPLAVRVTNVGFGAANNFQIQSAQPQILDNKLGLLVDFKLIGTQVAGQTIPNTLLIPFGNVAPQGVSQASWIMTASLSGRFVSFTSTFTHAADLGGQLTSLLQSINTYTLLKDVLVDLPGRDQVPDFLVNTTQDRTTMQALLDSSVQPPAQLILESDQLNPLPVAEVPGALSGSVGGTSASLTYTFTGAVSSNVWVHSYAAWPYGKGLSLSYARRSDGKLLNGRNVWISKHFRKSDLSYIYWINLLDLTATAQTYTLVFSPSGIEQPPNPVTDLAAVTFSSGGSVALTWSAPGLPLVGGGLSNLFGAHVFIDAETTSTAAFSPTNAQVSFGTSATSGSRQSFVDSSLVGNTTYYVALFTQDTGGNMSGISNLATSYTLPDPPTGLVITTRTANTLAVSWQIGNNALPINYQVALASAPFGIALSSSPFQDSFNRTFAFTGLLPGTTYFIRGFGLNPLTNVAGPPLVLGSTATLPGPRDVLPPRTSLGVGAPSFSSAPVYVTNLTTFTLSAVDDALTVGDGTGVGVAQSFVAVDTTTFSVYSGTFSLVSEGSHTISFYSVDLLGNIEVVHSSAAAVDLTAPITTLFFAGASTTTASGGFFVSSTTYLTLASTDPVSNGVASGVAITFYTIDVDPSSPGCLAVQADTSAPAGTCANEAYGGPFTLAPGTHTVYYFSDDNVGNSEPINFTSISVDTTPPVTTLAALGSSVTVNGTLFIVGGSSLTLTAIDPTVNGAASGVKSTFYLVDVSTAQCGFSAGAAPSSNPAAPAGTCANPLFAAPFALTGGTHTVSYASVDNVGNLESFHAAAVFVSQTAFALVKSIGTPGIGPGQFDMPDSVAVSPVNNLMYVSDAHNFRVQALSLDGKFQFAFGGQGSGPGQFGGSALPAVGPAGAGSRGQGIFVADPGNYRIQRFSRYGFFLFSFGSQGTGPGQFQSLFWIAVDTADGVWATDEALNRVSHFGLGGFFTNSFGTPGTGPGQFNGPRGVAVQSRAGLPSLIYVLDAGNKRIQVFKPRGVFLRQWSAPFVDPRGLYFDPAGLVYVTDPGLGAIWSFDSAGNLLGLFGAPGSGPLQFNNPLGLSMDAAGRLYVADAGNNRIQKLQRLTADVTPPATPSDFRVAGASPWSVGFNFTAVGNDGMTGQAALYDLRFSAAPISSEADYENADPALVLPQPLPAGTQQTIRANGLNPGTTYYFGLRVWDNAGNGSGLATAAKVTPARIPTGSLSTVTGGFTPTDFVGSGGIFGPATLAIEGPTAGLAVGTTGNLYIAQIDPGQAQNFFLSGVESIEAQTELVNYLAGANGDDFAGDGGPSILADLNQPNGLAVDAVGDIFIADTANQRIRRIDGRTGIITTIAGTGAAGFSGDGGPAASAVINSPEGVALNQNGDIYFTDTGNNRVRRIGANGVITTVAGAGAAGFAGDGGPATQALLSLGGGTGVGLALDPVGDLFIADYGNNRVRRVDARTGLLTTAAGDGTTAILNGPTALAVDPLGQLYVAESSGARVRIIDNRGNIAAVAGTGVAGGAGIDISGLSAQLNTPDGLALDARRGILYISDLNNGRIVGLGVSPFATVQSAATIGGRPQITAVSTAAITIAPVGVSSVGALAVAARQGLLAAAPLYQVTSQPPGALAQLSFLFDPAKIATATVALYVYDGVSWSSSAIVPQGVALSSGLADVTGTAVIASLFGVFARDVLPPRTTIAISSPQFSSGGTLFVTGRTSFTLSSVDDAIAIGDALGVGTSAQFLLVDGIMRSTLVNPQPAVGQIFVSTITLPDADGLHALSFYAQDLALNRENIHITTVAIDNTPPVTSLSIGSPQALLPGNVVLVSSLTPFALATFDPLSHGVASGVNRTLYGINGAPLIAYTTSFTLNVPDGNATIAFQSTDNVGNQEILKSSTVVLDSTPPSASLMCPAAQGFCSIIKGAFPVIGSVSDLHLASWRLEYAPGQNASSTFTLIAVGTAAVSSNALGTWDASRLSGWQTLRLTATDLVLNTTVVTENVFVGEPAILLSVQGFEKPTAVAVGPSGLIYVADTNRDRIVVLTSTGGFNAQFGRKEKPKSLDLSRPSGVAVDATGNVYIADTGHNRVLKLLPSGQLVVTLGRTKKQGGDDDGGFDSRPGSSPGEFKRPTGLALDASGDLFVSDSGNHRVQKFGPAGNFLLAINLPTTSAPRKDKEEERDDSQLGRPVGLALDLAGDIYVADQAGYRVLKYDPLGNLLQTFTPGLKAPTGVAVSSSADCLVIADTGNDRLVKLDRFGAINLVFGRKQGERANGGRDDNREGVSPLSRPSGLAFDAGGNILLANRGSDQVLKLGAPTGTAITAGLTRPVFTPTSASAWISQASGGAFARPNGAGITVPPGALPQDMTITVSDAKPRVALEQTVMDRKQNGANLVAVSTGVEYGPDGTQFKLPVTITVPYDPDKVLAAGLSEMGLQVFFWNRDKQDWQWQASTVDLFHHTVNAQIFHFSLYEVMGRKPKRPPSSAPAAAPIYSR